MGITDPAGHVGIAESLALKRPGQIPVPLEPTRAANGPPQDLSALPCALHHGLAEGIDLG